MGIIIVFYKFFKVVYKFRYFRGHRIKKNVSTILKFLIDKSFNLYFLKLVLHELI